MPDWTWLLLAALFGALSALAVPVALLIYFVRPFEKKPTIEEQCSMPVTLPPEILNELTRGAGSTPEGVLNAMLQFIFQQSTADTRWLRRRMASELAELLAKTSSGKIFESLTLRSLEVGTEFPSIANMQLLSGELEDDGARLRSLDIRFDLAYDGNFRIDVDAVMLLGKIANISITVESISGSVRLMFRRNPYTHWALAFESQPKLDLRVRGRFQGRQLKPRLASLVAAHIRRAVAQRHTLPNYKIRYKPFFPKSEPGSGDGEEGPTPQGRLTVRLVEVTRLQWPGGAGLVRAALAVDSHGWVSLRRGVLVLDIVVPAVTGPLGLVCCQGVGAVLVDTVVPMSPAYRADLRRDDVVLAIDNKPVNNVAQVGKLLRSVERRAVTVRVRRGGAGAAGTTGARREDEPRRLRTNFSFRRVSEVMEGVRLQSMRAATSRNNLLETDSPAKLSDASSEVDQKQKSESAKQTSKSTEQGGPGNFGLRKRRCSVENKSSDSSAGSTPPASGASTPLRQATIINKIVKHPDIPIIKTDSSECKPDKTETLEEEEQIFETGGPRQSEHVEICQMFWTKSIQLKPIIPFDEETDFKLNENHKYLNINVWATVPGEKDELLLGYLNIPLAALLSECQDSTVPHHMKRYQFLPPDVDIKFSKSHKLSSHAGFEPCLCFGDALVWWEWEGAGGARSSPRPATRGAAPRPQHAPARAAHDFVRTHFHRSTQCDFCNKKIWLKDAMQCRNCGLCCHKKCVTKCQESSPCIPKQEHDPSSNSGCSPPELITTEPDSMPDPDSDEEEKPDRKDSLDVHEEGGGAMSALVAGLRRAGSAHSLSAPRTNASSRSLPPSPSHTPRRQSLEGGPFGACAAAWAARGAGAAGAAAAVRAMLRPALRSALPPDALLAAARDCAPDLADKLTATQIHELLQAVREELSAEDAGGGNGGGEAGEDNGEGRACALTALMLHCCAAAQLAQRADAADPPT
ncbi:PDZ domain-containing protein 8 isoform X2 [Papilio machaon]|uniref:PDZ domain-containing protein 8 isoform X2 n=1 Tax=Papilio machaon TaxID=76193 RepID=UPI001E663EE9|nr:PDZ domain-containing protein 8 isoform X2 [Papilio machaon]